MLGCTQKPTWNLIGKRCPQNLPDRCPDVAEDTITVTKKIGYKYLWADMFCIVDDPSMKHDQIGQMYVV
jgi:hypothetical protein